MKHCASCGRDIPESGTVCEPCEKWAAATRRRTVTAKGSVPTRQSAVAGAERKCDSPRAAGDSGCDCRRRRPHGHAAVNARGSSAGVAAAQKDIVKPQVKRAQQAVVVTQAWSSQRRAFWTGNQRNSSAFELPAENIVPIWLNQVRPLLIVRCMSKRTEAFVFTGSALKIEQQTEDHTVRFRFDDEQETTRALAGLGRARRAVRTRRRRIRPTPDARPDLAVRLHAA